LASTKSFIDLAPRDMLRTIGDRHANSTSGPHREWRVLLNDA
jgi:hypothetical protein